MEQVGSIIKAAQSGGSKTLARRGNRQLDRDSLVQMGTMLRQVSAAFPHQEYSQETTEVFLLTFEDLALEFGLKPLEAALRSLLSRQKFFPHPSEVREVLDEMAKKEQAKVQAQLPPLGCELCRDQAGNLIGFVLVEKPGRGRIVEPCECRITRELAKKKAEAKA